MGTITNIVKDDKFEVRYDDAHDIQKGLTAENILVHHVFQRHDEVWALDPADFKWKAATVVKRRKTMLRSTLIWSGFAKSTHSAFTTRFGWSTETRCAGTKGTSPKSMPTAVLRFIF